MGRQYSCLLFNCCTLTDHSGIQVPAETICTNIEWAWEDNGVFFLQKPRKSSHWFTLYSVIFNGLRIITIFDELRKQPYEISIDNHTKWIGAEIFLLSLHYFSNLPEQKILMCSAAPWMQKTFKNLLLDTREKKAINMKTVSWHANKTFGRESIKRKSSPDRMSVPQWQLLQNKMLPATQSRLPMGIKCTPIGSVSAVVKAAKQTLLHSKNLRGKHEFMPLVSNQKKEKKKKILYWIFIKTQGHGLINKQIYLSYKFIKQYVKN